MKTIPTILELAKVPPRLRVIGLPNGQCTIGTFLKAWRMVKALDPGRQVLGWNWYPMTREEVLQAISRGVEDRINLRAGRRMEWRENPERIRAKLESTVICECKWCGARLPTYRPQHDRFCEASCRRSYYS